MQKLSMEQAFRNAIEAERAAQKFYLDLAENAKDHKLKKFLEDMAGEEESHARNLESTHKRIQIGELPDQINGAYREGDVDRATQLTQELSMAQEELDALLPDPPAPPETPGA